MSFNLYTPERQSGETQANYRLRQAAAREAARLMTAGVERRAPLKHRIGADGEPMGPECYPRGYISGAHSAPKEKRERRVAVKLLGRRQYLKGLKAWHRGVKEIHDYPHSMLKYWVGDKGLVAELEEYYPVLCKDDVVIRAALDQIKVAEAALEHRVTQLDPAAEDGHD